MFDRTDKRLGRNVNAYRIGFGYIILKFPCNLPSPVVVSVTAFLTIRTSFRRLIQAFHYVMTAHKWKQNFSVGS